MPITDCEPQPTLPTLTANDLKVLRLVKAGDPYRDKKPGFRARMARVKTLDDLCDRGLVQVRGGLLAITREGLKTLRAQPAKSKRS